VGKKSDMGWETTCAIWFTEHCDASIKTAIT